MTVKNLVQKKDLFRILGSGCQCGEPECNGSKGLYIHSKCHPESPTWTIIKRNGTMDVVCAECEGIIVTVQLGDL